MERNSYEQSSPYTSQCVTRILHDSHNMRNLIVFRLLKMTAMKGCHCVRRSQSDGHSQPVDATKLCYGTKAVGIHEFVETRLSYFVYQRTCCS